MPQLGYKPQVPPNKPATPDASESKDAAAFWVSRGELKKDLTAVAPTASNNWYTRWTRTALQAWTMQRVVRHIGPRISRAADLGCGFGDWTVLIAGMADEIEACDVSPGFVAETQQRLAVLPQVKSSVVVSDIRQFQPTGALNFAYLGAVMMYLEDADCVAVMKNLRHALAPTSVVISRDWCAVNLGRSAVNTSPWFSVHRTPQQYVALAAQAGLRVVEWKKSASMYSEQLARAVAPTPIANVLTWPIAGVYNSATCLQTRCSVSFVMMVN
jgi:SAM-dependent methyltransferase